MVQLPEAQQTPKIKQMETMLNEQIETLRKKRVEVIRDIKGMRRGNQPEREIDKACDYLDELDNQIWDLEYILAKHLNRTRIAK